LRQAAGVGDGEGIGAGAGVGAHVEVSLVLKDDPFLFIPGQSELTEQVTPGSK